MVSAVSGDDASNILETISSRIKEAGGQGLKENGVFNNAYVVAGPNSGANRDSLGKFNESFSAFYEGSAPAGRTAQFIGGIQSEGAPYGISNSAIFA